MQPFAEIIESSLTKITAQCWDVEVPPSFGQCIQIKSEAICVYALVYHIQTGSFDTLRKPSPFKKTIAELKKEQPHIFEFLITTFTCIPIAYSYQQKIIYGIPPQPPSIHEFILPVDPKQIAILFAKKHFLMSVFNLQDQVGNVDELIISCFRFIYQKELFYHDYYVDFLDTYALLTGNDYKRVKLFASKLEELL
ncbi:hypothetical protein EKK58_01505 [Candidatus Dependentiae bacterium]|nr:MAG: hypothetical protein EKK58_01505 [Candidatus Dependentiae bacterium]